MNKEFKEYCGFRYIQYSNKYECLADKSQESKKWLKSKLTKLERSRYSGEFAYISKLRDNPNKFVAIRYNNMGIFTELLTTSTELDIELRYNNKLVKPHISSNLTKIIKKINNIQDNKNYLSLKEFKSIIKNLENTYYKVEVLNKFDNVHIFNMLKTLKNDENSFAYIYIKT